MPLYALNGIAPVTPGEGTFWIADGARVMGQVTIGRDVSIWFNAVLRGDTEMLTIGEGSNIQDGCVVHADPGFPTTVGRNCTIGHNAILHGCTLGDNVLVGMGATVLNGAKIGANSLIGANALVTEGKEFPQGSLIVGQPARVLRALDEAAFAGLQRSARVYQQRWKEFAAGLKAL